jgi:hypothetical protein
MKRAVTFLLLATMLTGSLALADPPGYKPRGATDAREREDEKQRELQPERGRARWEDNRYRGERDPYEEGYYSGSWARRVRYRDESPAFFPDGRRVIFSSNRAGRDRELYVADLTAPGNPSRLTFRRGDDHSPAISPDGRRVAFVSERDGSPALHVLRVRTR